MKKVKNLVIGALTVSILAAGGIALSKNFGKKETKEEKEKEMEIRRVVYYNNGEIVYTLDEVGKNTLDSIKNFDDIYMSEEAITEDYMAVSTYNNGVLTNTEIKENKYKRLTR